MSAYMIAAINIHDQEKYDYYLNWVPDAMAHNMPELVVSEDNPLLLEGQLPGQKIVVLRFRDEEAMKAWFHSKDYQEAIKIRDRGASVPLFIGVNDIHSS